MLLQSFFAKRLRALVPADAEQWYEPEAVVESGAPAEAILKTALDRQADLIVLGVRRTANFPGHLPPASLQGRLPGALPCAHRSWLIYRRAF